MTADWKCREMLLNDFGGVEGVKLMLGRDPVPGLSHRLRSNSQVNSEVTVSDSSPGC